ncbi:MAG: hypothetical protein ABIH82_02210 [Candidatus Woesearchaeota archaeon]
MDCMRCQGRLYSKPLRCGKDKCPIYEKVSMFKVKRVEDKEFSGKAPSVFVGRYNYPNINVGVLSTPEVGDEAWMLDAPSFWGKNSFDSNKIINFRNSLINSRFKVHTKSTHNKFLEETQLISLASRPVDLVVELENKPVYQMKVNDVLMPMGPRANLRKFILSSNPYVKRKIDTVVSDTDLKAVKGLERLYKKGVDENDLSKILSLGNLGVKRSRRLVPTRWSITATHDSLGKYLISNIKSFKETGYRLYFGGYLGNYYLILVFSDVWSFELFEMYLPNSLMNDSNEMKFCTDHEFYSGRKTYASNCVGGYYNCRFAVTEKLNELKRQGSVLVLRFITNEYKVPLGSWVCTEATKKAIGSIPLDFSSREELVDAAQKLSLERLKCDISDILKQSKVLNQIKTQKKLKDFFT